MSINLEENDKKYLLILSCSKSKKPVKEAPAIDLYDGPYYKILRKYSAENVDVLILSAKYGLIDGTKTISNYNQVMTEERAKEVSCQVREKLTSCLGGSRFSKIIINLGKKYKDALQQSESLLQKNNVEYFGGQIGERMHQLKYWLNNIEGNNI